MKSSQPNFLFFFPDQWRWDWLGAIGRVPVRTPCLDRLAGQGILFREMRVNCPLSGPSRAGLATGLRFHHAGVKNNNDELDPARPNFIRELARAGYQVMTSGKSDLHTASENFTTSGWHPHLDKLGFTSGVDYAGKWRGVNLMQSGRPDAYGAFLEMEGLAEPYLEDMRQRDRQRRDRKTGRLSTAPSPLPETATTDAFCGRESLRLLQDAADDKPWFMWINFPGPHEPFDPPQSYQESFLETRFPAPIDPAKGTEEDDQGVRRNYAAMIGHIDRWIGELIGCVEARGDLDNTYLIFASDHGEMLGDHGKWYKQLPYEASIHVPLIIAGPGIPAGRQCDALAELIDLNPTFLELAGLGPLPGSDGRSLAPLLLNPDAGHRATTISALNSWRTIFDGRHKLTEWMDGSISLWDCFRDPDELENLVHQPEYADISAALLIELRRESPWFPGEHGYRPGRGDP
ncbi:MAG: sulfatase-like hydrolase/transferase [Opitutaceae bacterium]